MNRARQGAATDGVRQIVVRIAGSDRLEVVVVRIDATRSTVQVQGELDLATAGLLASALDDELERGHRLVRLDLSRLSFMDCAGLRVLIRAHDRFLDADGKITLVGARPQVMRLLALTSLDETLFVADGPARPRRPRCLAVVPRFRRPRA